MLTNRSERGTFIASLPPLVMPPAGAAVAGMLHIGRGQAGIGRIDQNKLPGRPAVKQAAPGRGRVRLPNAAFVVALTLARRALAEIDASLGRLRWLTA